MHIVRKSYECCLRRDNVGCREHQTETLPPGRFFALYIWSLQQLYYKTAKGNKHITQENVVDECINIKQDKK